MTRGSILLFWVAVACVAIAAEQQSERIVGWGTVVDPDHDCRVKLEKEELVISVPGTAHDLSIELNRMNAPRVVQEVEGDFIVQVKVTGEFVPKLQAFPERYAYHGAGLLLMKDEKTYIRLEHAAVARPDFERVRTYVNFELRENGSDADKGYAIEEKQMAYLRLERHGDKIAAAVSEDGVLWNYLESKAALLPTKLQVGVAAVSSAKEPFAPRFSGLKIFRRK